MKQEEDWGADLIKLQVSRGSDFALRRRRWGRGWGGPGRFGQVKSVTGCREKLRGSCQSWETTVVTVQMMSCPRFRGQRWGKRPREESRSTPGLRVMAVAHRCGCREGGEVG